jgi:cardiolipin synthase
LNASRRGVRVRVLLDSTWFNVEEEDDNDEMVARINKIAEREGLPLEARCAASGPGGVVKIHNKGVIVDECEVLVSSINWNENSPGFNREVGVIIEDEEAANYFQSAFEKDWNDADPGTRSLMKTDNLKFAGLAFVIIIIGVLYVRKHLRR